MCRILPRWRIYFTQSPGSYSSITFAECHPGEIIRFSPGVIVDGGTRGKMALLARQIIDALPSCVKTHSFKNWNQQQVLFCYFLSICKKLLRGLVDHGFRSTKVSTRLIRVFSIRILSTTTWSITVILMLWKPTIRVQRIHILCIYSKPH